MCNILACLGTQRTGMNLLNSITKLFGMKPAVPPSPLPAPAFEAAAAPSPAKPSPAKAAKPSPKPKAAPKAKAAKVRQE